MNKYIKVTGTHVNCKVPLKGKGFKQLKILKSTLDRIEGDKKHLITIVTNE